MYAREFRRSPRVPVSHMVVGLPEGNRFVRGDVSCTGVGFELPDPVHLKVGDPIAIQLTVPERAEALILSAVVTRVARAEPRSVGRAFVGASFVDVDALVENPLFRYVEESALLSSRV